MRRSVPDSGVLIRLKAQMAEVRSKMSSVKGQAMEVRRPEEARPGPSGAFGVAKVPTHRADPELDLLERAAAARSRPCRPGERSSALEASAVDLDSSRPFCPQPGNLCPLSWTAVAPWS